MPLPLPAAFRATARRRIAAPLASLLLMGLAACSPMLSAAVQQPEGWTLTRLNDSPLPEDINITLAFDEQRISGAAPCNGYSADFETGMGNRVSIGPVRMTRRACPDLALEQAFTEALGQARRVDYDGGTLSFSGRGGTLVFTRGWAADARPPA